MLFDSVQQSDIQRRKQFVGVFYTIKKVKFSRMKYVFKIPALLNGMEAVTFRGQTQTGFVVRELYDTTCIYYGTTYVRSALIF